MIDGVSADGDERVGRQLGELVPVHAQLFAEGSYVDLVASGKVADHVAQLFLGLEAAQPAVELLEQMPLLGHRRAVEALFLVADEQPDACVAGDDRLEHQPPKLAEPIGKACRDVYGERNLMLLEDGISPIERVAVSVIDGDADEA